MNHKISIILLLVLFFSFFKTQGQEYIFQGSFEECKKIAQKEDKLILVDMYFTGCMPCAEMDKKVFTHPQIQDILSANFVLYKTNIMTEEDGKKLARKYGAPGFPTFVLLNQDGKALMTESGFFGVNRFSDLLINAVKRNKQKKYLAFDADLNKNYHRAYSERFIKTGSNYSFSELESYLAGQSDLFKEEVFIVNSATFFTKYDDWAYTNLDKLIEMYGANLMRKKIGKIAKDRSETFGETEDLKGFREMLNYLKPTYNDKLWEVFLPSFIETYYSANKNVTSYFDLIEKYNLYPTWEERSNALGQIIIDKNNDATVLNPIRKEYENTANINSTLHNTDQYKLAVLYYYLGDFQKAKMSFDALLTMNPVFISKENLLKFGQAIKNKNTKLYIAENAKRGLPILLD